jgi:phosphate transport system permease protein
VPPAVLILLALGLGLAGWLAARSRAWAFQRASSARLHSLPNYHGWYVALWTAVPALGFALAWPAGSAIRPRRRCPRSAWTARR